MAYFLKNWIWSSSNSILLLSLFEYLFSESYWIITFLLWHCHIVILKCLNFCKSTVKNIVKSILLLLILNTFIHFILYQMYKVKNFCTQLFHFSESLILTMDHNSDNAFLLIFLVNLHFWRDKIVSYTYYLCIDNFIEKQSYPVTTYLCYSSDVTWLLMLILEDYFLITTSCRFFVSINRIAT